MRKITTIGLDLAKNVFQVHGIDNLGNVMVRRQLRRGEVLRFFRGIQPCLVGIEACGSSHYWAREIEKLGHVVKLMPAGYVKPYVKRGKTDAADAEAICEAVTRPTMRFVAAKSADQQSVLMMHKVRELLVRQRTMLINSLRGHLSEFGVIGAGGAKNVPKLVEHFHEIQGSLPELARAMLWTIIDQLQRLGAEVVKIEKKIVDSVRADAAARRLLSIPGVGPITASAITAAVSDIRNFSSGRRFASWLGLTPRPHSSGGKERMSGISKQGDGYIRKLLVVGATAIIRFAKDGSSASHDWAVSLMDRKPARVVTVALANKTARIIWALLVREQQYMKSVAA
ncbi:IS110 family transposase (plasmid) [Rhizobium sp. YTUHZ045]|uniref:IS110 family transposase n=1 Tax=Rhizobium TaxID=379 RepID=UPI0039F6F0A1